MKSWHGNISHAVCSGVPNPSIENKRNYLYFTWISSCIAIRYLSWPHARPRVHSGYTSHRYPHYWSLVKNISRRWIPLTNVQYRRVWYFLCYNQEQALEQTTKRQLVSDAIVLMWCHCYAMTACEKAPARYVLIFPKCIHSMVIHIS